MSVGQWTREALWSVGAFSTAVLLLLSFFFTSVGIVGIFIGFASLLVTNYVISRILTARSGITTFIKGFLTCVVVFFIAHLVVIGVITLFFGFYELSGLDWFVVVSLVVLSYILSLPLYALVVWNHEKIDTGRAQVVESEVTAHPEEDRLQPKEVKVGRKAGRERLGQWLIYASLIALFFWANGLFLFLEAWDLQCLEYSLDSCPSDRDLFTAGIIAPALYTGLGFVGIFAILGGIALIRTATGKPILSQGGWRVLFWTMIGSIIVFATAAVVVHHYIPPPESLACQTMLQCRDGPVASGFEAYEAFLERPALVTVFLLLCWAAIGSLFLLALTMKSIRSFRRQSPPGPSDPSVPPTG